MIRFLHFSLLLSIWILAGCIPVSRELAPLPASADEAAGSRTTVDTFSDSDRTGYACVMQAYPVNLDRQFAARSARVRMVDDNRVEINMWVYRPERAALEQGRPTPAPPPDDFEREFLPTDYEVVHYDLQTGQFTEVTPRDAPLRSGLCWDRCETQVLDESPDGAWQLIAVRAAVIDDQNGIWLVHRDHFQRLVAPFDVDEFHRSSEAWWRWQSDSSGLFLSYFTVGERPEIPIYVDLNSPPAYTFLLEGVHFSPGLFSDRSLALNDDRVLLDVTGPVVRDDGTLVPRQWFVYEIASGTLRQATADDFEHLARYLWIESGGRLKLIEWTAQRQSRWIADHPTEDIWNTLADDTLFAEPYRSETNVVRVPTLSEPGVELHIIDCAVPQE